MTEPQVWVLIGVFATALFGMLTLMSTMFMRLIRAEFQVVYTRLDSIEERIELLNRDINALMRHTFGIERD